MTNSRIRLGIIGMGSWGARVHLPAFTSFPDVDVVAVVDPDEARARTAAEAYGVERVETDAYRLFRDPDNLDAVVIATPDDTHRDLVIAAFDSGLHVLCEKPIAYDVRQGEEMLAAAKRAGRIAKIDFLFRYSPVVSRMRELIDEGLIGEVQMFERIEVNPQFFDPSRPLHWKMQRKHANGGVFVEYGSHSIDLALWFGGDITKVVAHGITMIAERPLPNGGTAAVDGDDAASWIAEYANGGQALFRSGWTSLNVGSGATRIYGSKGTLLWEQHGRTSESLLAITSDDREGRTLLEYAPPREPAIDAGPFPIGISYHYTRRLDASFIQRYPSWSGLLAEFRGRPRGTARAGCNPHILG